MEEKELPIVETKPRTYLCRFDADGRRGETHLSIDYSDTEKQKKLEAGFVEITEEEWDYYVGNKGTGDNGTGYIRGKDGKPISAPAYVPTKEEKLAQLDAKYDSDKAQLREYVTNALLACDDDLLADIQAEMTAIDSEYEAERQAILNG